MRRIRDYSTPKISDRTLHLYLIRISSLKIVTHHCKEDFSSSDMFFQLLIQPSYDFCRETHPSMKSPLLMCGGVLGRNSLELSKDL